jgi:hypothetical protein
MDDLFLLSADPTVCGVCLSVDKEAKKKHGVERKKLLKRSEVLKRRIEALEAELSSCMREQYQVETLLGNQSE